MGADGNVARDPRNAYLWRMNPRRLEAEVVRDAVLACAGRLDLALGGPELAEHLAERGGDSLHRRSIYFRVTPDNRAPMLAAFDLANPNACYRRQESIVPQQALVMMNSAPAMDCSRILARELTRDSPTAAGDRDASVEFVAAAFERVLSRSARAEESAACVHFLSEQTSRFASGNELSPFPGDETERLAPAAEPWLRARESLILVLFSHHEFITLR